MIDELVLSNLESGVRAKVVRIAQGPGFRQKVLALGIRPGSVVRVQSFSKSGPLVVQMDGSRIAVGRGVADRIFVQPLEE